MERVMADDLRRKAALTCGPAASARDGRRRRKREPGQRLGSAQESEGGEKGDRLGRQRGGRRTRVRAS
jgi:hypothetical protein